MVVAMIALAAAAAAAQEPPLKCPGRTTYEINRCMARDLDGAQAQLDRYRATARQRILSMKDEPGYNPATVAAFDAAEKAWEDYRLHECRAVYEDYAGGTIRGAMGLGCRIALTKAHTRVLWANWLQYFDRTPPILPDPAGADAK